MASLLATPFTQSFDPLSVLKDYSWFKVHSRHGKQQSVVLWQVCGGAKIISFFSDKGFKESFKEYLILLFKSHLATGTIQPGQVDTRSQSLKKMFFF